MCCVPEKDTLHSDCLSPPSCINGYWEEPCDGLASHSGGSRNTRSLLDTGNGDKQRPDGPFARMQNLPLHTIDGCLLFSQSAHVQTLSLNFTNSSFVIRVNLLHP